MLVIKSTTSHCRTDELGCFMFHGSIGRVFESFYLEKSRPQHVDQSSVRLTARNRLRHYGQLRQYLE